MTRAEREIMIGRYMGGVMNSSEEQEFFIQVALDPELRLELKAHRTVESAIRKDRDAEPTGHTALRARIAGTLAAHPPQATTSASTGGQTASGEAASRASDVIVRTGSTFGKWAGGAAAFVLAAIVSLVVVQQNNAPTTPVVPTEPKAVPQVISSPLSAEPARSDTGTSEMPVTPPPVSIQGVPEQKKSDRTTDRRTGNVAAEPIRPEKQATSETAGKSEQSRHSLPDLDGTRTRRADNDSVGIGVTIAIPRK